MVYCFYTADIEARAQAWLNGRGKPGAGIKLKGLLGF
jgi:hypothetical protein